MPDFRHDQAEGLRRLLDREQLRMTTVTAGCHGVGRTSVVINLATAYATRGNRVLIIDENYGPANVIGMLGVRARYNLGHVMRQTCELEEALIDGPQGVSILSAAGGARALCAVRQQDQAHLVASFARLDGRYDLALIDTPCGDADVPGVFSRAVRDTIIVSSASTEAITASYSLIKRMRSLQAGRNYYMLLNRVTCESNARVAADNLRDVAQGYLATPLQYLGSVPRDENVAQAARGFQPVVDACPAAPSALSFKRIADSIAAWPRIGQRREGFDSLMQRLLTGGQFIYANAGV